MRENYWLRRHPVPVGLVVGVFCACVAVLIMGLLPHCPFEWTLLAMVGWGFGRPVSAQVAMLVPVCLVGSIFSGMSVFIVMLPIVIALVLAHLLTRCEEVPRWGSEHFGYLVVISVVYYLVLLSVASAGHVLLSIFVYALIVSAVIVFLLTKSIVRPFQRKPGSAAYRFAGRR